MKFCNKIFFIMVLGLSSCDLNRIPLDQLSDSSIWLNEESAMVALTGLYRIDTSAPPTPKDWWSSSGLVFLDLASDNAFDRRGVNSDFHRLTAGTLLTTNKYIKSYWQGSYKRIALCNDFLAGVEQLQADPSIVNRFKAEARFIRAAQYFYLSQFYGDIPLVVRPLSLSEANSVSKTSKSDIIDFIIKEFKEASYDLPRYKDLAEGEIGRASKQAALGFLGRVYLSEKMFSEAAEVYYDIIELGDNIIVDDYESLFVTSNQNCAENIFSAQYLESLVPNDLFLRCSPAKFGGYCFLNPSSSLFEAYQFIDGTDFDYESPLYNWKDLGENRDSRMKATLLYDGTIFKGQRYASHPDSIQSPDRIEGGQTTQTGFLLRKYIDESYEGSLSNYGGNIPILRYAEILLGYLEAKLESGATIDQPLLDMTINKIRGRQSVNMPAITETDKNKLRTILRNERRVELALEGVRLWDLMRWEIAHEVLNGEVFGAPFPDAERVKLLPDGSVDKYGRWYVTKRNFRKEQDYRWPIPQSEQDINPNLR